MGFKLSIQTNSTRAFRNAKDYAFNEDDLDKIAGKAGTRLKKLFIEQRLRKKQPDSSPGLHHRTGELERSMRVEVEGAGGERQIGVSIGNAKTPYVKIQEEGGVIYPTGSRKFLAIPMDHLRNPLGPPGSNSLVPRKGWESPSTSPLAGKFFFWESKFGGEGGGKFLAVSSRGKKKVDPSTFGGNRGDGMTLFYLLKESVKIPGTLGFLEFATKKDIKKKINDTVQDNKRQILRRFAKAQKKKKRDTK